MTENKIPRAATRCVSRRSASEAQLEGSPRLEVRLENRLLMA